jgi:hypothetical protein
MLGVLGRKKCQSVCQSKFIPKANHFTLIYILLLCSPSSHILSYWWNEWLAFFVAHHSFCLF